MSAQDTFPAQVGRPTVITDAIVGILEDAFRVDATVTQACSLAGISRDAYYDKLKRDPEFSDRIARAQVWPFIAAKKLVMKAVLAGDGRLAFQWLRAREPERYHERKDSQTTVKGGISLLDIHRQADEAIKAKQAAATKPLS